MMMRRDVGFVGIVEPLLVLLAVSSHSWLGHKMPHRGYDSKGTIDVRRLTQLGSMMGWEAS